MRTLRAVLATSAIVFASCAAARASGPWSVPANVGSASNGGHIAGLGFGSLGTGLLGWSPGFSSFVAPLNATGEVARPIELPQPLAAGPALDVAGHGIVLLDGGVVGPRMLTRISWASVSPGGALGRVRPLAIEPGIVGSTLAVDPRGDALAAWTEQVGGSTYRTRAAWRPAGERFAAPVTVFQTRTTFDTNYPAVAIGPDGRAIVVEADGPMLRARLRAPRGGFGRVLTIGPEGTSTSVTAGISDRGRVFVVWGTQRAGINADSTWVVRAARLTAAGRFGAPQILDPGGSRSRPQSGIALAFRPGGQPTVAWSAVGAFNAFPVMAANAKDDGRFAAPQRLAPSGVVGGVAVRADGAAVVVWDGLSIAGFDRDPTQVFASVRPAGATAFGAPEAIGGPEDWTPAFARVAFNPVTGRPTVAWSARPAVAPGLDDTAPTLTHVATRTTQGLDG